MPGIILNDTDWKQFSDDMGSALTRLLQVETFNGEMDGRQKDVEETQANHEDRTSQLERWRQSADATMVAAEKTANDNKAAITALQGADVSIINRIKPLEAWKPQVDSQLSAVVGLPAQLNTVSGKVDAQGSALTAAQSNIAQAQARLDGLASSLNSLTKTVQGNSTQLGTLVSQMASFGSQVTVLAQQLAAMDARVKKLETPVVVVKGMDGPSS